MAKKERKPDTPRLFTVYYMNQEKVYEMRMLLDNRVQTGQTSESTDATANEASLDVEAGVKLPFLNGLKGELNGKHGHEKQAKMVDTLEFINTKSRMLSTIIDHCDDFKAESTKEGGLVYIGDVSLNLLNENEVRALATVMSGTLNGIKVPEAGGLDIGNMLQSFIKTGASFKLRGSISDNTQGNILLKIPIDGTDLFESRYSIDDLLIGKVGVVGICKGKVKPSELRSSYDYFQAKDKPRDNKDDGFVDCTEKAVQESRQSKDKNDDEATYIDVLAIIQAVEAKPGTQPC